MTSHRSGLYVATALVAALVAPLAAIARSAKPQPKIDAVDVARRIHALVNQERAKQKLPALAWTEPLAKIAAKHSRDMARRTYFSHDSPEGQRFSDRYRAGGYECAIRIGDTIYGGAENLALNHLYNSVTTVNGRSFYDWNSADDLAHQAVTGWMNSPGHRRNILTPHWKNEGLGIAVAPDGKVYVTQNFC